MTAGALTDHLLGSCCLCEHSTRLHGADGCIAARCNCRLTDAQVRFVERLHTERVAHVDFDLRARELSDR